MRSAEGTRQLCCPCRTGCSTSGAADSPAPGAAALRPPLAPPACRTSALENFYIPHHRHTPPTTISHVSHELQILSRLELPPSDLSILAASPVFFPTVFASCAEDGLVNIWDCSLDGLVNIWDCSLVSRTTAVPHGVLLSSLQTHAPFPIAHHPNRPLPPSSPPQTPFPCAFPVPPSAPVHPCAPLCTPLRPSAPICARQLHVEAVKSSRADGVPPGLLFQHVGHQDRVIEFQWAPKDPWTFASVSSNVNKRRGGGTLQMWRVLDLVYRPAKDVVIDLNRYV
ncbi:unnamed protein product [Closterium sp. NIES-54]